MLQFIDNYLLLLVPGISQYNSWTQTLMRVIKEANFAETKKADFVCRPAKVRHVARELIFDLLLICQTYITSFRDDDASRKVST